MSKPTVVAAVLAVVLAAGVAAPLSAEGGERGVAETVWYQGFLADVDTGDPIDGIVTVVATLYDAIVDGSVLWGPETHAGTVVTEGWFNIELGDTDPLVAFIDPPYYLELTIAGEILEPRQKLASVPMALRSAAADSGDGDWTIDGTTVYHESGRVAIGTSVPNGLLTVRDDGNAPTTIVIENQNTGAGSAERLTFSNEDGDVAYISCYDDDNAVYESMMVIANNRPGGAIMLKPSAASPVMIDSTGNVGIGVTSPASKLDVSGTAEMLGFKLTTSPTDGYLLTSNAAGVVTWQAAGTGGDSDWTIAGDDMYAAVSGDVGIGTTTPASKLDVDGTIEATGFKMTTSPSDGYVLSSDSSGTATWRAQHLVDVHDEETVTMIGGSATQFDDTQVSLTVPGRGYIICTSTVWVGINHANNESADHLQLNHSTSPTDMGSAPTTVAHLMMATEPIGSYYRSFSVHSTHSIVSAGTYTYYLVGRMLSGQDIWDQFVKAQMTAVYYPS